jgi:hypothetical protein
MPPDDGTVRIIFASVAGGAEPDGFMCDCFLASRDAEQKIDNREGGIDGSPMDGAHPDGDAAAWGWRQNAP